MSDVFPEFVEPRVTKVCIPGGLTKRELFAGLALNGILSSDAMNNTLNKLMDSGDAVPKTYALFAVSLADGLIKELESDIVSNKDET